MIAGSLFAADAPKKPVSGKHALSSGFAKAALKAAITLKNQEGICPTITDESLIQAAMNEAEAAVVTDADADADSLLRAFKYRSQANCLGFRGRVITAEASMGFDDSTDSQKRERAITRASIDPQTAKDNECADAYGEAIIKMLRSGNYSDTLHFNDIPQCGQ